MIVFLIAVFQLGFAVDQSLLADEPVRITTDKVLNTHADQVGIWVNTNTDPPSSKLATALRQLRIRSIRYGWQFGVVDFQDLSSQQCLPNDPSLQGYLTKDGRMAEQFGPGNVARLLSATNTVGFAVTNTDGINYFGKSDPSVNNLSRDQRIDLFAGHAERWAKWSTKNRFEYFEIGNENDLSGEGSAAQSIGPWTPESYAEVASRYADTIKKANPNAKCGINGGLKGADQTRDWFGRIATAVPTLEQKIDFLVCHKYEMGISREAWQQNAAWEFGRVGPAFRQVHGQHFSNAKIHVTEIGPWKEGENDQHYRAVLATEMLGNVRLDSAVQFVHFWPTRWGNTGGVFQPVGYELKSMGVGLAAYTRFAQPNMCCVGVKGGVRYFAAIGEKSLVIWCINHATEERKIDCEIQSLQLQLGTTDKGTEKVNCEHWSLHSPSNSLTAADTRLERQSDLTLDVTGSTPTITIPCRPISATIVTIPLWQE
ncbi:MAG: hypothetical protein AAFP90_06845 [Planctomycetota bacterium]